MNLHLQLMSGIDIPIPQCQLILHQPTIKEISFMGEQDFFMAIQVLTVNKSMINQGETLLADIHNFQIFMTIMNDKETVDKKNSVLSLFNLIFPTKKIMLLPASIIFSSEGETAVINENNFEDFQEIIKAVFCLNSSLNGQQTFNPANEQARQIADKLMRGRARVAAQKSQQQSSIFGQYLSIITIGVNSMSLQDCLNLTMYQLFDLVERYMLYIDWDIDIRSRLAGAQINKPVENWMKEIH